MADISDLEQAIVDLVTSALYPTGTEEASVVGVVCRIYRGWPNSTTLSADLNANAVNVTVTHDNDSGRTTTRYFSQPKMALVPAGVIATASGQTIVIDGTPAVGDVVGAIIDQSSFHYRVQDGDTVDLVSSCLAQTIHTTRLVLVQGNQIVIPGARSISVRVTHDGTVLSEIRRQEKDLRIAIWCPSPEIRDSVAAVIDGAISQISFLPLVDSTEARLIYKNTSSYDQSQSALLYRRDLTYVVEYATTVQQQLPTMVFGVSGLNGNITYS